MKHIAFLVITFFAMTAFAQEKPAAATELSKPEAAKPEAKAEPMKEAAKPAPSKSAAAPRKGGAARRWNEDARHCLERASNTEVIKCAEEFL